MNITEEYLRRAMEAERKAASGSEEFRRRMLDMALQWRDLARQMARLDQIQTDPWPY